MTAMGLARPDKSRGKPSSLLKNDDDYRMVFGPSIDLAVYLWSAKLQLSVDSFIASDAAKASLDQRNNLRFHLSMLIVDQLNNGPVRGPGQLRALAASNASLATSEVESLFNDLKQWSDEFLARETMILERAAKIQRFSDYLLKKAAERRSSAIADGG